MLLLVGLGNPSPNNANNRHNVGFLVIDSIYNRRLFPNSPVQAVGPASGHKLLQTSADPKGRNLLGTWNNCGSCKTPWGTFLTCEENLLDQLQQLQLKLLLISQTSQFVAFDLVFIT